MRQETGWGNRSVYMVFKREKELAIRDCWYVKINYAEAPPNPVNAKDSTAIQNNCLERKDDLNSPAILDKGPEGEKKKPTAE